MSLFKPVSKKVAATTEKNFIDDLVDYFAGQPEVNAAYFGFAYDETDKTLRLFLAVDHNGDAAGIQNGAWKVKLTYMSDTEIHYAAATTAPRQYAYICQHNAPFYHRNEPALLQQKVMKRWFDEQRHEAELIATLQQSEVYTIVNTTDRMNKHIVLQTISGRYEKFIPLFSHQDMIAKSQMTKISEHEVHVKLPFEEISKMAGKNALYVLNPFTPFEVNLHV